MSSFIEVVSGFLGAAISVTVCNPMDVMRVRYQVQGQYKKKYLNYCSTLKKIAQQEGFRGFYRGYSIALISIPLFNAAYFPLYEKLKKECSGKIHNSTLNIAISCGLSGLICNVILNPLWVLKTRMQTEIFNCNSSNLNKVHLFKIASHIIKNQGVKGLYNGLAPSLFGVLHPIIYFPLYENLKMMLHEKALFPNSLAVLLATIIGKSISCTICYPHELLRSWMMNQQNSLGLIDVIKLIYSKHSLRGFYSGLGVTLLRVIPQSSILFLCYELIRCRLNHCKDVITIDSNYNKSK